MIACIDIIHLFGEKLRCIIHIVQGVRNKIIHLNNL